MHIQIKFLYLFFQTKHKTKTRNKCEEQTKKGCHSSISILGISFLGQASSLPTPNPSQICHNQRTIQEKKKQLCILGFLVRIDVYPIHLQLKNFTGTHEPYFTHTTFNKMISL